MKLCINSIKNLLQGLESSKLVFLFDNYNYSGIHLFNSIVSNYSKVPNRENFCVSEKQSINNVHNLEVLSFDDLISKDFHSEKKTNLFIHDINYILLKYSVQIIVQKLKKISQLSNISTIIVLCHEDCITEYEFLTFNRYATAALNIKGTECQANVQIKFICDFFINKQLNSKIDIGLIDVVLDVNHKILSINEYIKLDNDCDISCKTEIKPDATTQPITTFNIDLKPKELEAKNKLVLPYLKSEREQQLALSGGDGISISYCPDEYDDEDDEDPDDDLDF